MYLNGSAISPQIQQRVANQKANIRNAIAAQNARRSDTGGAAPQAPTPLISTPTTPQLPTSPAPETVTSVTVNDPGPMIAPQTQPGNPASVAPAPASAGFDFSTIIQSLLPGDAAAATMTDDASTAPASSNQSANNWIPLAIGGGLLLLFLMKGKRHAHAAR
jgi:hypothetical protein